MTAFVYIPSVFSSTNGTAYVRFNTVPKESIQRSLNLASEEFVHVYLSTLVRRKYECLSQQQIYVWTYSWLFSYPLGPECTEQWKIFSQVLWSIQVCINVYPYWVTSCSANLVSHISLQKTAWEKWQIRKKRVQHHQWWAIFW